MDRNRVVQLNNSDIIMKRRVLEAWVDRDVLRLPILDCGRADLSVAVRILAGIVLAHADLDSGEQLSQSSL